MKTVPAATTVPTGKSAGSLQVSATSPLRVLPALNTLAVLILNDLTRHGTYLLEEVLDVAVERIKSAADLTL